ncbi:MAG: dTMP kinase [Actinomycetota bacterium]|nr:dTMP kinase [Actinomycetota bacterium]
MFIVFEGIDGVGKSTQIELLVDRLLAAGYRVMSTREPGGTEIGEKLRDLLKSDHSMGDRSELLLMLASRSQHVDSVIRPALEGDTLVICDRFEASTFAYQGYGRGMDLDQLRAINEFATGGLEADVTFLIDREGSFRVNLDEDRFESAGADFAARVRKGYKELARQVNWFTIDGDQKIGEVHREICDRLFDLGLAKIRDYGS